MKILILIVLLTFFESKAFVLQNPYWFMEKEPLKEQVPDHEEQVQDDEEQVPDHEEQVQDHEKQIQDDREQNCLENGEIIRKWNYGDIRNLWLAFMCHMIQESDIRVQRISFKK